MDKKKNHVIKNSIFALKIVFKFAPVIASVYAFMSLTSAVFTVVQVLFLQKLVDGVAGEFQSSSIILWGCLYVASLIAAQAYQFSLGKMGRYLNRKLTKALSPAIVDKFTRIEYQYFENADFKDIMSRMTQNPQQTVHNTFFSVVTCISQVLKLIGILGVFFNASLWIGFGAALIGIPMSVLDLRATNKQQRLLREATTDQRMSEYRQGLFADKNSTYEIKIFRAKNHILDLWNQTTEKIFVRYRKITKTLLRTQALVSLLKIAYTAFAVITLALGFISGDIKLGVLVSIVSSLGNLFSILTTTSYSVSTLGARTFETGYFREFLDFTERAKVSGENITGHADIVFDNVYFKYPGTDREILRGVSFTVHSGEKCALVGVNGAGKSTIIKLLCGLYKPDSGHLYIGGKNITELSQDALRHAVSVVFQDFGTYQLTLRENIAFGDLSQLDNDDKLTAALKLASASEISHKGLDINLGRLADDGVDVSKGQWQRIAVARAFLSDAEFIVLDEPTASLDPIAESKMYESFSSVLKNRGTIIISHRLASARLAEKIIVIESGEVIETGSHDELMQNGGLYSVMYEEQSGWYKEATV